MSYLNEYEGGCPVLKPPREICPECDGSGDCQICYGDGFCPDCEDGDIDCETCSGTNECPVCWGDGGCQGCGGSGKVDE